MTQAPIPQSMWLNELADAPSSDSLTRFLLQNAPVRGEIVSLDDAWQATMRQHSYPASVRQQLGELCASALLLAATLKFDGSLTIQIHGDGPVALMVVECQAQGPFRATAKIRDAAACTPDADLTRLVNVHGRGRLMVTLEPSQPSPERPPYQSMIALTSCHLNEVLEHYMTQSEQVPTRLWLATNAERAVGMLLQKLPETGGHARGSSGRHDTTPTPDDDSWPRMQHLAQTLTQTELLQTPAHTVLRRLFWQEPLCALDTRRMRFACRCSRSKVTGMLKMLGQAEVSSMLTEQTVITVQCDFCQAPYQFDPIDAAQIFLSAPAKAESQARH